MSRRTKRKKDGVKKNEKQLKPAPQLPLEMENWSKQQQHQALLNILSHNLGSAVRSVLLRLQLEACHAGIQTTKDNIESININELAINYQQIYEEEMTSANELLEDHILVFFVTCQLYIVRVVEAARWFKSLEGNSTSGKKLFELKADIYGSPDRLRHFGTCIVKDMTIAECLWHLGNYAKHHDEPGGFRKDTETGLKKLDVCQADGSVKPDAIRRGLRTVTGPSIASIEGIENGLKQIVSSLRAWAEQLEDQIISDLDDCFFSDPSYTKRFNDSFRSMLLSQGRAM